MIDLFIYPTRSFNKRPEIIEMKTRLKKFLITWPHVIAHTISQVLFWGKSTEQKRQSKPDVMLYFRDLLFHFLLNILRPCFLRLTLNSSPLPWRWDHSHTFNFDYSVCVDDLIISLKLMKSSTSFFFATLSGLCYIIRSLSSSAGE